ncbi:SDR family oxidoreductase [Cyanobacteria bacterium FACHB-472]|nr:SDR family oxidoreductase [Cyanobacteria bacterium FACHB-472]
MGRSLKGKVAVVTGGSKGLGQAFAKRLAEDGADIAIAATSLAQETEKMVKDAGRKAEVSVCDVCSPEDVSKFAALVMEKFGRCDILVNNAGIYPYQSFDQMSFNDWRKMMAVNLDSLFLMCKAFLPSMKQNGYGRIINLSSTVSWLVIPDYTHYTTAKMGVIGFTRALASEVGEFGITVNAIAPGLVRTGTTETNSPQEIFDMVAARQAIKRTPTPDDVVGAVSFLASDDAAFITGQTLIVDGGLARA